jgi:hypothetical protein
MSSVALVEQAADNPQTATWSPAPSLAEEEPAQARTEEIAGDDPHPLVPVFIIGALAFLGTLAFVGGIIMWLALRHSGVMAP